MIRLVDFPTMPSLHCEPGWIRPRFFSFPRLFSWRWWYHIFVRIYPIKKSYLSSSGLKIHVVAPLLRALLDGLVNPHQVIVGDALLLCFSMSTASKSLWNCLLRSYPFLFASFIVFFVPSSVSFLHRVDSVLLWNLVLLPDVFQITVGSLSLLISFFLTTILWLQCFCDPPWALTFL